MIGRTLGSYRVTEQVGVGGMAAVFKAYDAATDRYVALKVLPEIHSNDPTFRTRFEREAKAIARLEHINILPIFAYGEENGTAYLVMRYMQTGTLKDRITAGPLPLEEISRLLGQIAAALDHAHSKSILHRDVKPSNILIDADGNAFLTDFGIAKMVESAGDLTGSGLIGTPQYMSPEQCEGRKDLTPASDQYSLGVMLYEMVIGKTPFNAETPLAVILKHLNEPLPPPRTVRPDLPEGIERVLLKALAKQPDNRFPTCSALAAAFAQAVASAPAVVEDQQRYGTLAIPAPQTHGAIGDDADRPTRRAEAESPVAARRPLPRWLIPAAIAGLVVIGGGSVLALGGLAGRDARAEVEEVTETPEPAPTEAELPVEIIPSLAAGAATEVVWCGDAGRGVGLCFMPWGGSVSGQILPDMEVTVSGGIAWSPDGTQIVFSGISAGDDPSRDQILYIVNADGTDLHPVDTPENDVNPAWSPDGQWLAFHSSGRLALMRPDGTEYHTIYETCIVSPQWSPDSQRIVFNILPDCGGRPGVTRQVAVIGQSGGDPIVIATLDYNPSACGNTDIAFSPDGTRVFYYNDVCQPLAVNADGTGETAQLSEAPHWWLGKFFPQWGGVP